VEETREPLTGPPPRAADLAGRKTVLTPIPLHMKFNKSNAAWLSNSDKLCTDQGLDRNFVNRVAEGSTKSTWDRHRAVQNSFNHFCTSEDISPKFPLSNVTIQNYASWCDVNRNLKADSIRTYLYSLSKIQQLKGYGPIDFHKIPQLKDFLRGVKNVPRSNKKLKSRKAVSFSMLKLLGNLICQSHWNSFNLFCTSEDVSPEFPLSNVTIQNYASWCDVNRNLKADSIKTYLYSLSKIQQLKGYGPIDFHKIPQLKDFLRGVKNVPRSNKKLKSRKAVSFSMLKLLGNLICHSHWSSFEKTLTWTSFLVSYFGSLRISELICEDAAVFDVDKTLCWKDVVFGNCVTLHLRSPKVDHAGGDLICLFPFPIPGLCPVAALRRLREKATAAGLFDQEKPVFRLESGACWKRSAFDRTLRSLVAQTGVAGEDSKITGHSFRGGIPSLLAVEASPAAEAALKEWGRWRSQAYVAYTQFHIATRKEIFDRIIKILLK